jgi:hypothetical protein
MKPKLATDEYNDKIQQQYIAFEKLTDLNLLKKIT